MANYKHDSHNYLIELLQGLNYPIDKIPRGVCLGHGFMSMICMFLYDQKQWNYDESFFSQDVIDSTFSSYTALEVVRNIHNAQKLIASGAFIDDELRLWMNVFAFIDGIFLISYAEKIEWLPNEYKFDYQNSTRFLELLNPFSQSIILVDQIVGTFKPKEFTFFLEELVKCNRPFKLVCFGKSFYNRSESHVLTWGYSPGEEVNWFSRNVSDSGIVSYSRKCKFNIEQRMATNMCKPRAFSVPNIFGVQVYSLEEDAFILKDRIIATNKLAPWQQAILPSLEKINRQQANWTLLNTYARMGEVEGIHQVASMVPDFNQECLRGEHPLLAAIQYHQYGVLIALLNEGAKPNIKLGNGLTPLLLAIDLNDETCVRLLLEGGADPDFHLPGNASALFYAADYANLNIVEQLIAKRADPTLVYMQSKEQLMNFAKLAKIEKQMLEFIESKEPLLSDKIAIRPDEIAKIRGFEEIYEALSTYYIQFLERQSPIPKLVKTGLSFWQGEQSAQTKETIAYSEKNSM